jgi:hypothetical protein
MSNATGIVRWQSTADPSRCGVEVSGFNTSYHRIEAEIDKGLGKSGVADPAFVFASVASTRAEDIATAVFRASRFTSKARVCVALEENALSATDAAELRKANVGILLDGVDAHTRLSAISTDLIEAVRFDQAFLKQAQVDSRSACVLAAMLGLAHDLGLATLGAVTDAQGVGEFTFDYVVAAATASSC